MQIFHMVLNVRFPIFLAILLRTSKLATQLFLTTDLPPDTPTMSMTLEDASVRREPRPAPNTPESIFAQLSMVGKTVAITGGADGIGYAVAEAVAEAGADVALWYNSNKAAIGKAKQLEEKYKIKSKAYQVEVSDFRAVESTMQEVVNDFGKLDVFVANAGMAISKAITDQTVDEYKKQMSVNGEHPAASRLTTSTDHANVWQSMACSIVQNMPAPCSSVKGSETSSLHQAFPPTL